MWPAETSDSRFFPSNRRSVFSAPAVDGVHEIQIAHAEIVVRARFDEHFLDRRGGGVAPRLADGDRGRLIRQDVDRVLRRGGHALAGRRVELDPIEPVLVDLERPGQRRGRSAFGRRRERAALRVRQHDLPARRLHRRQRAHADFRALEDGDVAAVLDLLRRESRVGREVVFELEPLHVRKLDDLQREDLGADAVGLDEITDRRGEIEQHAFVLAVVAAEERDALVGGIGRLAHEQRRLLGVEPGQLRGNGLVRAARHGRVAGRDLDAIGGGRQDVARHDEQRRQRVAEVRGTEPEERDGADGERRERQAVAAHRHALDAAPAFNLLALVHRRLDELADERRRVRRVGAAVARFDGADDGRLQGRLVLFEVERDLLVARAAHQRPHEQVADQAHERDAQDDAEGDDGART